MSMARSLTTSWGRKGRKGCTRQVLLAAVAAVAGSILSAPPSFNLWEDLFSSPEKWHDFREHKAGKRVPEKHPDFKRLDGSQSLWLESRSTPDWVLPKVKESNIWKVEEALVPKQANSREHLWQDLLDSPQDWEDFRFDKPSPKFPDFKRKGDRESGLWLNSAPDWVTPKLEEIESKLAPRSRRKARSTSGRVSSKEKEHLWQDLCDSPQDWEDFRFDKPSPKFPDFKRTGDQESGLWLNSAPDWVTPKLEEIESKLAPRRRGFSSKEHLWQDLFGSPQDWEDFRFDKPSPKFPDFKRTGDQESGLWLDSAPDWVTPKLEEIESKLAPRRRGFSSKEHLWQDLFGSPQDWEDFRFDKPSPKFPDFKRTGDQESGLWLNSAPDWVTPKLEEIESKLAPRRRGFSSKEHLWQDLFGSPQDWEDFRFDKPSPKFPDFKRTGDQESGLWLDSAPDWVTPKLEEIESKLAPRRRGFSSKEHLWQDLFGSPQDWEDFRFDKPSPKFPDFKRTGDRESGLWLNSAPDWVTPKLEEIESKLAPGSRRKARSTSGRVSSKEKEHLWQDLCDSPQDWEDFRFDKPSPKFPDFKRTGDRESGLWLRSAPDWVTPKLEEIESKLAPRRRGFSSKEHLWQDLFGSPQDWEDFRFDKPSPKFPDFKRTGDQESGLWLDSAPDWVTPKLEEIESKLAPRRRGFSSKEHLWQDLFGSPQDWEDFRFDKPSPKFPDFKRTGDQESGLWLNSAPDCWLQYQEEKSERNQLTVNISCTFRMLHKVQCRRGCSHDNQTVTATVPKVL